MHVHRKRKLTLLAAAGSIAAALVAGSVASPAGGETVPAKASSALVSVASPTSTFELNQQVQPALAVDPVEPDLLVSTAYDSIDTQPCSEKASIDAAACTEPATPANGGISNPGVGLTGVYFSFDSGHNWIQPTYHGLTAAGCNPGVEPCKPVPGPIHTVPNYYEHGLATFGDSSVAFGPVLRDGKFSWANGSRLYLSNIAMNLTQTAIQPGKIDSNQAQAVSYIDDPTPARVADQSNWSAPVIVPKTAPAVSTPTLDQIWADNASSSRYFGTVYLCYNDFYFEASGQTPVYPTIAVSHDGGKTWTVHHVAPPLGTAKQGYREGCAIRTDSHGTVYAVFTHMSGVFPSDKLAASEDLVTSLNGGATWTQPAEFMSINTGCYYWDPLSYRCAEEGPAGNAAEPAPSIDIANGAPTGAHATNEIVLSWVDGRLGQNHEAALLSYSANGARTWSAPARVSVPSDRAVLAATAIAPDGSRVYETYTALTTPFSPTMSTPRLEHGVLRSAAIGPGGAPADWVTDYSGPTGDARGTAFGVWNFEEYTGWYISAVATTSYGAGVWTDLRDTPDCPAFDAWREKSLKAVQVLAPAPWPLTACPANWGNSKIWVATTAP
jgi:hypothetical protein